MEIGVFSKQNASETLQLSTQTGWNHLETDWQRCVDLNPDFCLAGFVEGRLVATTTVSRFGDLGWIGTFLVDNSRRRKGFGTQMLEAALAKAKAAGMTWFALDSSDVGRPIYVRHGFQLDEGIERWTGPSGEAKAAGTETLSEGHWAGILSMDREVTGVEREKQLRHLAGEPGAAVRVLIEAGKVAGYGFSRAGRLSGSVGPLVAKSDEAAKKVFESLLADRREKDGDRGIALDLLGHETFKAYLTERGFGMRRRNIRMFWPEKKRAVLSGASVYLATGLGMG